jgi:hypothetical protein
MEQLMLLATVNCVASGDWSDPSIWLKYPTYGKPYHGVPDAGDSVVIGHSDTVPAVPFDVVVTGSAAAQSIVSSGSLSVDGNGTLSADSIVSSGSLRVNGTLSVTDELEVLQATITGTISTDGNLTIQPLIMPGSGALGAMTCYGATIGGTGAITNYAYITISGPQSTTITGRLTNTQLDGSVVPGQFLLDGNLAVSGSLSMLAGSLSGPGELTVMKTGTLSAGGFFTAAELVNEGTANITSRLYLGNGSMIDNMASGVMTLPSDGVLPNSFSSICSILNDGLLRVPGSTIQVPFNQGGDGTTQVIAGTMTLENGGAIAGSVDVDSGAALDLSPPSPIAGLQFPSYPYAFPGSATVSGPGTFTISLPQAVNELTLDVTGSLTDSAPGSWVGAFTGAGTVTNQAELSTVEATLQQTTLDNSGTIDAAQLALQNGAVFDNLDGGSTTLSSFDGDTTSSLDNSGALSCSGPVGVQTFEQTSTGTMQVSGGSFGCGGQATIAGSITIATNNTLSLLGTALISDPATISGPGSFTAANLDVSSSLTVSGTNTCTLDAVTGGGTVTLQGTISVEASFDGANLDIAGTVSLPFGFVDLYDGAVFDNPAGSSVVLDNTIVSGDSTSSVENNGSIDVTSGSDASIDPTFDQSASGRTQVDGAFLSLGNGGAIGGSLSIAAGATLDFGSGTFNLDSISSISGPGDVQVSNSTVNDPGNYDISGTTTIDTGGLLNFADGSNNSSGDVTNDGTLELGTSLLHVGGNYTQSATGTLEVGIAGLFVPGIAYGQLDIASNASLAGTLVIDLLNGFVPRPGDGFEIIRSTSRTGDFDFVGLDLGDGNRLHPGWDGGNLWLDDGFVVTTPYDSGHGSLRFVMMEVNDDLPDDVPDAITFDSSAPQPFQVSLKSSVTLTRDDVTLTGLPTTEILGAWNDTALTIAGNNDSVDTLTIKAAGLTSGDAGIVITGNDDSITRTELDECGIGILISGGASDNTIGGTINEGNLVTLSQSEGIRIQDATTSGNLVAGNRIGDNVFGNLGDGIFIGGGASDNTIGGPVGGNAGDSDSNVISNNDGNGVHIQDDGTSSNVVEDNFIGTDSFGLGAEGNLGDGVLIEGGAAGNVVIGNVVSANGRAGIELSGDGTSTDSIKSNWIGIAIDASAVLPNLAGGVLIDDGATSNTVNGDAIAGNIYSAGVLISGSGSDDNLVEASEIGTTSTGALNLGNKYGVVIQDGASDNTIGGTATGAGNTIADNSGAGVIVGQNAADGASGDAILGNTIFANGKLGIDLADDGVTLNDSSGHAGPNLFQDFPVLTSAISSPTGTTVTGTVHGPANSMLRVELFSSPAADPSGYGQGQTFLGAVGGVATDANGDGTFTFNTLQSVGQGVAISATATDANNNTSEFSQDLPVVVDVTQQIRYTRSGIVYNRFTGIYTGTITLTNTGTTTILGPIQLVLTGLTPGVTLINASGTTWDGNPYITASGPLTSGGSITITLQFRKSSSGLYISYVPRIYSGSFAFTTTTAQKASVVLETTSKHPIGPIALVARARVRRPGLTGAGRLDHIQRER